MKNFAFKLRMAAVAALVVTLAACGGSTTVSLGGTVSGLTDAGLVLQNNGGPTVTVAANATSYVFPQQIDDASQFNVAVLTSPDRLSCNVSGGVGRATGIAINSANVVCAVKTFALGGNIKGLTSGGLQLTNGADIVAPAAGASTFKFAVPVADGAVYGIAVLSQPTNQTCTVVNGTAVMGGADVLNVQVNCQ